MALYGQYKQDRWLILLARACGLRHGCIMECGAFDGVTFSNSRALIERGWRGVLIDADDRNIASLRQQYHGSSDVSVVHAALSDRGGVTRFYRVVGAEGGGATAAIGSVELRAKDRWSSDYSWESVDVKAMTIETAMTQAPQGLADVIVLDIEGGELAALSGIGQAQGGALTIALVEYNQRRTAIVASLQALGLTIWADNGHDIFAIRSSALSWPTKWVLSPLGRLVTFGYRIRSIIVRAIRTRQAAVAGTPLDGDFGP